MTLEEMLEKLKWLYLEEAKIQIQIQELKNKLYNSVKL